MNNEMKQVTITTQEQQRETTQNTAKLTKEGTSIKYISSSLFSRPNFDGHFRD